MVSTVHASSGPCPFSAYIDQGETLILCPGSSEYLSTGFNFEFYQWYRQSAQSLEIEPVEGETSSILEVFADTDSYYFFWCEVTLDGCTSATNLIFIDSYIFPPTSVSAETLSICEGESTTLVAQGTVGTYEWYFNGIPMDISTMSVTVSESGEYSVSIYSVLCPSLELPSQSGVDLVVHPTPVPTIYFNDLLGQVCIENAESNIEWFINGALVQGANQTCTDVIADGSYVATVLDEFGCRGESQPLALTNVSDLEPLFSVYPNPFDEYLIVNAPQPMPFRIVDAVGNLVVSSSAFNQRIDLSVLKSGIYFLQSNGQVIKLVK